MAGIVARGGDCSQGPLAKRKCMEVRGASVGLALFRRTAEYLHVSPAHHLSPDGIDAVHACWFLLVLAFSLHEELLVTHVPVHLIAAISQWPPVCTARMQAVAQALV